MLTLAATLLLSVTDPQDGLGDGGYSLPTGIEAARLDMREFSALDNNNQLELRIRMSQLKNPSAAPLGFSGPQLELFIDDGTGKETILGDTGFHATTTNGWNYHLQLNGWLASFQKTGEPKTSVKLETEGNEIVVHPPLPAKNYRYYVLVGIHDPLNTTGLRQVSSSASVFDLASPLTDAPAALDVLSPDAQLGLYAGRELPPVGKIPDRKPWLLLSGFVGLLLSALATLLGGMGKRK